MKVVTVCPVSLENLRSPLVTKECWLIFLTEYVFHSNQQFFKCHEWGDQVKHLNVDLHSLSWSLVIAAERGKCLFCCPGSAFDCCSFESFDKSRCFEQQCILWISCLRASLRLSWLSIFLSLGQWFDHHGVYPNSIRLIAFLSVLKETAVKWQQL